MQSRTLQQCLALAASLWASAATAQPVEPVALTAAMRLGDVPAAPGTGADAMAVLGFFRGFPSSMADARDLLEGRSVAPAFDVWCGAVPYVDFTNGTVLDSAGLEAPTALCLPFLDPAREMPPHTCATAPGLPAGRYFQGGGLVLRIEGALAIRAAGDYTFAWGHDDGVAFRFGDARVFEYPDPTGSRVDRRVVRAAAPGLYPFTLEWYDTIGGALLDWYVAPGDLTAGDFDRARFHLVPREDLYPSELAPCTARCDRCEGAAPVCDRAARRCVACTRDAHCGPCAACVDQRCAPLATVPGADGGPACAPDAGVPDAGAPDVGVPDAGDRDASAPDAALDGGAGQAPEGGGCSCRAGAPLWHSHGAALGAAVAALWLRRRRRP